MIFKKNINRIFIIGTVLLNTCLAKDTDILVNIDGLTITEQMLRSDIFSLPENQREHLLSHAKPLNEYIDIFYREKLFEHLAIKQHIDQQPAYTGQLKALKRRLLVNLLVEDKKNNMPVPDMTQSAKEFYQVNKDQFTIGEQVEARHILLNSKPDNPEKESVHKQLTHILTQLKQDPDNFSEMAKKHSDDKGSAAKGGDLGKFSKGQMVAEFEREAHQLNTPGQLSNVFSTKFGFHIIQLIQKHPAHIAPFEQVKNLIIDKLRKEYIDAEYIQWRNSVVNPEKAQINQEKLHQFVQQLVKAQSVK